MAYCFNGNFVKNIAPPKMKWPVQIVTLLWHDFRADEKPYELVRTQCVLYKAAGMFWQAGSEREFQRLRCKGQPLEEE